MIATSLVPHSSGLEIVCTAIRMSHWSEFFVLRALICPFLLISDSNSCMSFKLLLQRRVSNFIRLLLSLLTSQSWFAARAPTTWARWAKVHDYSNRLLISHLVASSLIALFLFFWGFLSIDVLPWNIFPSADASSILYCHTRLNIVAELKTASVVILTITVSIYFLLCRRPLVSHRNIIFSRNNWSDRRNIVHCSVSIRTFAGLVHVSLHWWFGCDHIWVPLTNWVVNNLISLASLVNLP